MRSLLLVLLLAGCAAQEIQSATPTLIITLNDTTAPPQAIAAADEHCARFGKTAVFDDVRPSGYTIPHNFANVFRCE